MSGRRPRAVREPDRRPPRQPAMRHLARIAGPLLIVGMVLAGCGVLPTADRGSQGPSAAPGTSPTPAPVLSMADLKFTLIDAYGPLWYCDPDFYPIQRVDEIESARTRWPEVQADAEAFHAIVRRLGLEAVATFTDEQKLAVYQAWKVLHAIALNPIGNETYRFDYLAQPAPGAQRGSRTAGTITSRGVLTIEQQAPADAPNCPICLARGTRIETPSGGTAVEDLRLGDPVWTVDAAGTLTPAVVIALGSTPVPVDHHVVRLVLADGRTATASPGHPLADGRRFGDLRPGDIVDGSPVRSAALIPYLDGRTYDLVASGPTGIYLVDGIQLGSTLRP